MSSLLKINRFQAALLVKTPPPQQQQQHPLQQKRYFSSKGAVECDYVVVGSGSAGSVISSRLAQGSSDEIVVLEAGKKDISWKIHMPAALMYCLKNPRYSWCYYSEPQKHAGNRVMFQPRGKVWGGSSSINAMVYIRGHPLDYDRWQTEGAQGWSYADCLPYFKKSQCHQLGGNEYRGADGPLYVSRGKRDNPLFDCFLQAGRQAGYGCTDDVNGFKQVGIVVYTSVCASKVSFCVVRLKFCVFTKLSK